MQHSLFVLIIIIKAAELLNQTRMHIRICPNRNLNIISVNLLPMPFDNMHLCVQRKTNMYFNYFYIVISIMIII